MGGGGTGRGGGAVVVLSSTAAAAGGGWLGSPPTGPGGCVALTRSGPRGGRPTPGAPGSAGGGTAGFLGLGRSERLRAAALSLDDVALLRECLWRRDEARVKQRAVRRRELGGGEGSRQAEVWVRGR